MQSRAEPLLKSMSLLLLPHSYGIAEVYFCERKHDFISKQRGIL